MSFADSRHRSSVFQAGYEAPHLYVQAVKDEEDRRRKAEEEAAKASSFSTVTCLRPEIRWRAVNESRVKDSLHLVRVPRCFDCLI